MEIWIPYGGTEVPVGVRTENLVGLVEPKDMAPVGDLKSEVHQSVSSIGDTGPLAQLIGRDDRVVIVTNLPSDGSSLDIIDSLLFELSNIVESEKIAVLWIPTEGWPPIKPSLERTNVNVRIVGQNGTMLSATKETLGGRRVEIDKEFAEATFRILVCRVGFSPTWGYTGGPTALLDLVDEQTRVGLYREAVMKQIESGSSESNAVKDLTHIFSSFDIGLALNVVAGRGGNVTKIFTSKLEDSFAKGASLVNELFKVELERDSDILIVGAGGRPYDHTLFGALDSVFLNKGVLKRGGAIILVAECMGGYGNDEFRQWMFKAEDVRQFKSMLKRNFEVGAEKAYLLNELLEEFRVHLVSVMPDYYARNVFRLRTSRTVNEALQSALRTMGKDSSVAVAPYGTLTRTTVKPRA